MKDIVNDNKQIEIDKEIIFTFYESLSKEQRKNFMSFIESMKHLVHKDMNAHDTK